MNCKPANSDWWFCSLEMKGTERIIYYLVLESWRHLWVFVAFRVLNSFLASTLSMVLECLPTQGWFALVSSTGEIFFSPASLWPCSNWVEWLNAKITLMLTRGTSIRCLKNRLHPVKIFRFYCVVWSSGAISYEFTDRSRTGVRYKLSVNEINSISIFFDKYRSLSSIWRNSLQITHWIFKYVAAVNCQLQKQCGVLDPNELCAPLAGVFA